MTAGSGSCMRNWSVVAASAFLFILGGVLLAPGVASGTDFTREFSFARSWGGTGDDDPGAVLCDHEGNIYVPGYFRNSVDFGMGGASDVRYSAGSTDVYLAKFGPTGTLLWVVTFGGSGQETCSAIALAPDGRIALLGTFTGTVDFDPGPGTASKTSAGSYDVFLSIFEPDGELDRVLTLGGTGEEWVGDLAFASDGALYLTGQYGYRASSADLDPTDGEANHGVVTAPEVFIVRLTDELEFDWAHVFSGGGWDMGVCLTTDSDGAVYAAGYFYGTIDFDPSGAGDERSSGGAEDCFVTKIAADGTYCWTYAAGGTGYEVAYGIRCTASDVVVLAGHFEGSVDFDPDGDGDERTSAGGPDAFVTALSTDGTRLWTRTVGGTGSDEAFALAIGHGDRLYFGGWFSGTADFDPSSDTDEYSSAGERDGFVCCLDEDGDYQWALTLGGSALDFVKGLACDTAGYLQAVGIYRSSVIDLDPFDGEDEHSVAGGTDVFFVQLRVAPPDNRPPVADAGMDDTRHVGDFVQLCGAGSSDPDGHRLTYLWTPVSMPEGSESELDDPTAVSPGFVPDRTGEYVFSLVVTDQLGRSSDPDLVTISTVNSAPHADAYFETVPEKVGDRVDIDATGSWDDDGDEISFSVEFVSRPAGSEAELVDADTATPYLVVDVCGDYLIRVTVTDAWDASDSTLVLVTFSNIAPVARARVDGSPSVTVWDQVRLDGTESFDPNDHPLYYRWSLILAPAGSAATIADATKSEALLVPDVPGSYVIQLVVDDGLLDSAPDTVLVEAVSLKTAAMGAVLDLQEYIAALPSSAFRNRNLQKTLGNKLNAVVAKLDNGAYEGALNQLQNDILSRMDGCIDGTEPDRNDWIVDFEYQEEACTLALVAIEKVEALTED